jgi:hypothetical protein
MSEYDDWDHEYEYDDRTTTWVDVLLAALPFALWVVACAVTP